MTINSQADVGRVVAQVRQFGAANGMPASRVSQFATAVSEIATNAVKYARGGTVELRTRAPERHPLPDVPRGPSLEVVVNDTGPGMQDLDAALVDHFSTGKSLGLGLSGARRLVDDMHVDTRPGRGTRVVMRKWV